MKLKFPDEAEKLFEKAEETALDRYDTLVERAKTTNKEVTVL